MVGDEMKAPWYWGCPTIGDGLVLLLALVLLAECVRIIMLWSLE